MGTTATAPANGGLIWPADMVAARLAEGAPTVGERVTSPSSPRGALHLAQKATPSGASRPQCAQRRDMLSSERGQTRRASYCPHYVPTVRVCQTAKAAARYARPPYYASSSSS